MIFCPLLSEAWLKLKGKFMPKAVAHLWTLLAFFKISVLILISLFVWSKTLAAAAYFGYFILSCRRKSNWLERIRDKNHHG
jgi:hypothetical protein